MVCLGRYIRQDNDAAEMGLVVKENYQGIGIGTFLCECLMRSSVGHGVKRLFAYVSRNNTPMLSIYRKKHFLIEESREVDGYYVSLDIAAAGQ
jgi:ribosomal protein S18 acetylase RimI-like enzyme